MSARRKKRPEGCQCPADCWRLAHEVPPICRSYYGDYGDCVNCEHGLKCHEGRTRRASPPAPEGEEK